MPEYISTEAVGVRRSNGALLPIPTFVVCRACGRPIDVWGAPGFRIDHDHKALRAIVTKADAGSSVCPECLLDRAAEEERRVAEATFAAQRATREEIAAPFPSTLYVIRSRGRPGIAWARGFSLVLYGLKFAEWGRDLPQPLMRLTSVEPEIPPLIFVWFGADVMHESSPLLSLRFRWSYADPERPARLEIAGWDDPDQGATDLARLAEGVRFFQTFRSMAAGGRPRGRYKRDRRWYLESHRALARELGRQPTESEFCGHYGLDITTVKRNLKTYRLWPWKQFSEQAVSARTLTL